MHVLIAAADVRSATSTKMILAKENLICDTTDLGEDGVQISRLYDYDLILLDRMRAAIEGYKMLRRLRAACVHTPILILSACGELDEKVRFLRVGADDYIACRATGARPPPRSSSKENPTRRRRRARFKAGVAFRLGVRARRCGMEKQVASDRCTAAL